MLKYSYSTGLKIMVSIIGLWLCKSLFSLSQQAVLVRYIHCMCIGQCQFVSYDTQMHGDMAFMHKSGIIYNTTQKCYLFWSIWVSYYLSANQRIGQYDCKCSNDTSQVYKKCFSQGLNTQPLARNQALYQYFLPEIKHQSKLFIIFTMINWLPQLIREGRALLLTNHIVQSRTCEIHLH